MNIPSETDPTAQECRKLCDEILDPLTGELVPLWESDRLAHLHERLEDIALELLSTCHRIRTALDLQSRVNQKGWGA